MYKKVYKNIFLFLTIILFLDCSSEPPTSKSNFINFNSLRFSEDIKLYMCDCYATNGFFTDNQLIRYIKKSGDIIDISIIENLEGIASEILIYNDSLILGDSFIIESSLSDFISNGLKINIYDCSFENKLFKKVFHEQEIVIKSGVPLNSNSNEKFYDDVKTKLRLFEQNEILNNKVGVYYPIEGERIKTSVIQFDLIENKWIISNVIQNHSLESLSEINNYLLSYIDTSRLVKEFQIEKFFVPIKFYEKYQLDEMTD